MNGAHTFYGSEIELPFSAVVHRVIVVHAFACKPHGYLIICDDGSAGSFGYCLGISYMVGMTMAQQYIISFNIIYIDMAGQFIGSYKGIKQQFLTLYLCQEAGMSVIRDLHLYLPGIFFRKAAKYANPAKLTIRYKIGNIGVLYLLVNPVT